MYTEAVIVIALGVVLASVCGAFLIVRRVKKQLLDISEALKDIKNGNGNRRILSETHELVAPRAYEINDIILTYENRLSVYRRTEETNRQLMTSLSHDVRTPLTTVHQLVVKLNGTITVESVPSEGTVFMLLFPLIE